VDLYSNLTATAKPPLGRSLNKPATIALEFRAGLDERKLRVALAQQAGVRPCPVPCAVCRAFPMCHCCCRRGGCCDAAVWECDGG
jgi:hypothetical protein